MEQFCASNGSWPRKARLVNAQPPAITPREEGGIRPGPSDPPAVDEEAVEAQEGSTAPRLLKSPLLQIGR
jgi:hypothetical protein